MEVKQRARYIHHELLNKPTKEDGGLEAAWKKSWMIESTNQYVVRNDRWPRGLRHPRCWFLQDFLLQRWQERGQETRNVRKEGLIRASDGGEIVQGEN